MTLSSKRMYHGTTAQTIRYIYDQLVVVPTLAPSPVVNALFGQLVQVIQSSPDDQELLTDLQEIHEPLRSLAEAGECEMEQYWSQYIVSAPTRAMAWDRLNTFWYLQNYRDLVQHEYHLFSEHTISLSAVHNVVFVGGGPLPLTAIFLWQQYGIPSIVLDADERAVIQSRALIYSLGLAEHITVLYERGETYPSYATADAVIVAALAGVTPLEKENLLTTIGNRMSDTTTLLVRSATGIRTLLYPEAPLDTVSTVFVIGFSDPKNKLINCMYLCKKIV